MSRVEHAEGQYRLLPAPGQVVWPDKTGSVLSTNQNAKENNMSDFNFESPNVNGSVPAAAVESKQQPEVKMHVVPITVDVQMTLVGNVEVYATCAAEAIAHVQGQIDGEALDDDIEMEDVEVGYIMSCGETQLFGSLPEILEGEIEVDTLNDVTSESVLLDVPKPFEDGRALVRLLRLESEAECKACFDSGEVPSNIPQSPDAVYKDQGWTGRADWLGSTLLPFGKAREFARGLGLKSIEEWNAFSKGGGRP